MNRVLKKVNNFYPDIGLDPKHRTPLLAVLTAVTLAGGSLWVTSAVLAQRTVQINAMVGRFSVTEITADPGEELTVSLTNLDLTSHGLVFELDGERRAVIAPIGLGRTESVTFAAPEEDGRYVFYSQAGNDRANGYEGYLLVGDVPAEEGPRLIGVEAFDYGYNPSQLVVRPGEEVTILMTNTQGFHDIVFDLDGGREVRSERIQANQSISVTFTAPLEPGVYDFYCSVGDHRANGMEGTLVVGEPLVVEGRNFAFEPNRIEASPGQTMIIEFVSLDGFHDLTFELEGGVEVGTAAIGQGERELLIFDAPMTPGDYDFYCSVGMHRAFGMEGVLVVSDDEPTPGTPPATVDPTATPTTTPPDETPTATPEGGTPTPGPTPDEPMIYIPFASR